jgi:hypothetical protein
MAGLDAKTNRFGVSMAKAYQEGAAMSDVETKATVRFIGWNYLNQALAKVIIPGGEYLITIGRRY